MSGARTTGVKSWDETYMMMARDIASMRSKDPCTQVGAFIADREHRPWATMGLPEAGMMRRSLGARTMMMR